MGEQCDSPWDACGRRDASGSRSWRYLRSSFRLHKPAPQHGLDVDVAQLTVRLQDLHLHHLLQQQPAQPPVEEGAGILPLQDVLQKWGHSPGLPLQKEEELMCSNCSLTACSSEFEGSSAGQGRNGTLSCSPDPQEGTLPPAFVLPLQYPLAKPLPTDALAHHDDSFLLHAAWCVV